MKHMPRENASRSQQNKPFSFDGILRLSDLNRELGSTLILILISNYLIERDLLDGKLTFIFHAKLWI